MCTKFGDFSLKNESINAKTDQLIKRFIKTKKTETKKLVSALFIKPGLQNNGGNNKKLPA